MEKKIDSTKKAFYYKLIGEQENIVDKLFRFNKLNFPSFNPSLKENNYLELQQSHFQYVKGILEEIKNLIIKSEKIEKEFVFEAMKELFYVFLQELDKISSLEKERANLLENERDESIIKILENQKKAIIKEIVYLIKVLILISENINNINELIESNVIERKALLLTFEECKNRCEKNFSIYQLENRLIPNNIDKNLQYDVLRIDKVIQTFLITFQEKLRLIRKNSEKIHSEIQNSIETLNRLFFCKSETFDILIDSISSKKIFNFFPSQIIESENVTVLRNNNEVDTETLDKDKHIIKNIILSQDIDISSIIAKIKLFIEDKLSNNNSMSLSFMDNNYSIIRDNKNKYKQLEKLLENKKWQEADLETTTIFMEVINKNSPANVMFEDLLNFPPDCLYFLDELWLRHSNGKYGFSVQKKIISHYQETIYGYKDSYENSIYKYVLKKIGRYKKDSLMGKFTQIINIYKENNQGYFPSVIISNIYKGWACLFDLIDSQ